MTVETKKINFVVRDTNKSWIAFVVRKINGKNVKVGEVKLKSTDDSFSFKGRTFPLNNLTALYSEKGKNVFLYDFDGLQIVDTKENKVPLDVKELDNLITRNIVVGFFMKLHGAMEKVSISGKIVVYIVVGIAGGALGYIIRDQMIQGASSAPRAVVAVLPSILKIIGVA